MRKLSITHWIFIAMFAGIAFGVAFPAQAVQLTPLSNIFLRLIKSIIAPLLFGTLVYGIAGGGHGKEMGRIGLKFIIYFEVVTTIALVVGLLAVNIVQPGVVMSEKGAWLATSANGQTISALCSADDRADLADGSCYNDTGVEVEAA